MMKSQLFKSAIFRMCTLCVGRASEHVCEECSLTESIRGTGARGEVSLAISGLYTFGSSARSRRE